MRVVVSGDGGDHYAFALERGALHMSEELQRRHRFHQVIVHLTNGDKCFGGWARSLVTAVVGYDTIVQNALVEKYGGRGFVGKQVVGANVGAGASASELVSLNAASEVIAARRSLEAFVLYKTGILFTTVFLYFTTTALVSFTLRETQHRMLAFTAILRSHVLAGRPFGVLVAKHVMESLMFVPVMVGILFFLFEFYHDQMIAFLVLVLVWQCELFSVISMRSALSVYFFPRAAAAYFTLFHLYFFSFQFGFTYLALLAVVLFLQHTILFLLNRHEVDAWCSGRVSAETPRESSRERVLEREF